MSELERPLRGSVVVVTGGTGGIGLETGRALVAAGAQVALGDLDGERAADAAAALGEGNFGARLDVTDMSSFEGFIDQVEEKLGPVDALVNNAGVMILGALDEESEEATTRSIQVNLFGVHRDVTPPQNGLTLPLGNRSDPGLQSFAGVWIPRKETHTHAILAGRRKIKARLLLKEEVGHLNEDSGAIAG